MANLQDNFLDFYEAIQITSTKKKHLEKSHNNLREVIRDYFRKNHSDYTPLFYIQGSYKMGTTIRTKDDECDLDDGVYFVPKPDIKGNTLQNWVLDAVTGITDSTPSHKNKCVRVNYAAGYHIDLPVYIKNTRDIREHPLLAVRDGDYLESDPRDIVEWFNKKKKNNDQLVRIVSYLKAWSDKMPHKLCPGLAWTTLAADNQFKGIPDRDDIALVRTVECIYNSLKKNFRCVVHGTPYDNLFEGYDKDKAEQLLNYLHDFINRGNKALEEKNKKASSKIWIYLLGPRFNEAEDITEEGASLSKLRSLASSITSGVATTSQAGNISEGAGVSHLSHVFYGE